MRGCVWRVSASSDAGLWTHSMGWLTWAVTFWSCVWFGFAVATVVLIVTLLRLPPFPLNSWYVLSGLVRSFYAHIPVLTGKQHHPQRNRDGQPNAPAQFLQRGPVGERWLGTIQALHVCRRHALQSTSDRPQHGLPGGRQPLWKHSLGALSPGQCAPLSTWPFLWRCMWTMFLQFAVPRKYFNWGAPLYGLCTLHT